MEVLIDGREFVPKDETFIEVHGMQYPDIANWLTNVHYGLLSKWVKTIEEGKVPDLECKEYKDLGEFEFFIEKYLGFKFKDDGSYIVECGQNG
jgi:hypothetical protein